MTIFSQSIIGTDNAVVTKEIDSNFVFNIAANVILIDAVNNNIIVSLGESYFNKIHYIKRIDISSNIVRVSGLKGNFEEDDNFTLIAQTVSGSSGSNTLSASADVSNDLVMGDTILVNDVDEYTIASISGSTITTNEALANTYSANDLAIGGKLLLMEQEVIIIFSDNKNKKWRSIK